MEVKAFSSSLKKFEGSIHNIRLQDSLNSLQEFLGEGLVILEWDENNIAIPITVKMELPTLGNFNDLDIQETEPVILVFGLNEYPAKAPIVYTDRLDFPKDKLAHLYINRIGRPPAFCYVRGSRDEWYANKRIQDLLIRISNWLRDAATGELSSNGNQFEPLRLEGYSGTNTYDYSLLAKLVSENKSLDWSMGLFEQSKDDKLISYQLVELISRDNYELIFQSVDEERKKLDTNKKLYYYGFMLWNTSEGTFGDYTVGLPTNWEEFKNYCDRHEIDYNILVSLIKLNHHRTFPVILAIKRPKGLIGFSSNIEFVNFKFYVDTDDVSEGKVINNFSIKFQAHNQPITLEKARLISGEIEPLGNGIIFGCGALGSKIVMHLARSGQTSFMLIDHDELSPHNLVRHALGAEYIGSNKAFALSESIKKIYSHEFVSWDNAYKQGDVEKQDAFKDYTWLLDCTASESFFNKLISSNNINEPKILSCSISDFGNLGLMFNEGANRNPRLDDLQAELYSYYESKDYIKAWLNREQTAIHNNLTLEVGVGCNSETTVLADEKVSAHAAFFAASIRREILKPNSVFGQIKLYRIIDSEEYSVECDTIKVNPYDVMPAINDSSWTVRFRNGIIPKITITAAKAKKKETGGIFIGVCNYKNKTIHVTDIIDAPPDSKGNPVCFYRGHHGLPEQIKDRTEGSGGQLGYIGEWHSHPQGPNGLSSVDMATVSRFKEELSELTTPLPVFLTVVTPSRILPFIY